MSETMKELLIQQKENMTNKVLGYAFLVLAFFCIAAGIFASPIFLLGVIIFPILSFVIYFRRMSVEYEYTYLDKEIRIDRIYNMNKRKNVATLDIGKIEILARKGSESLRGFEHRQVKVYNYAVGEDTEFTEEYELWYDGQRRILVSLDEDFMKPLMRFIPQKIKKQ